MDRFDLDQEPLINAVLIDHRLYFHDLDSFPAIDRQYGGDLRKTIQAMIALAGAHTLPRGLLGLQGELKPRGQSGNSSF